MNWLRILVGFWILVIALIIGASMAAAKPVEFPETELLPIEGAHGDRLLNLNLPLLRCGEVVFLASNPERMAIVLNYRWTGWEWVYQIRGARYKAK